MSSARVNGVVRDVPFLFQDTRKFGFDSRVRNEHLRLLRTRAIADARQKISNRVCNGAHTKNQAACAAGFLARSLNGIPISLNSDLASSSVRAVVTIVTSNPMLRLILSSSTSGKIDWSEIPSV